MESTGAGKTAQDGAASAYEAFAPVYDDFTARNDYELWLGAMLPWLEKHGLGGPGALLDVGCGTGKSFLPMLERGWRVSACDISPAMVEIARAKVGETVELAVADMRELPLFGSFELVWALDDAVNYLLSEGELERALRGMRRNLAGGGLLTFDVNTLSCHRAAFAGEESVEANGRRLVWKGRGGEDVGPGSICEAGFEVRPLEGGGPAIEAGIHRQRHFPEAQVLAGFGRAGLECVDVIGHGPDGSLQQPLDELAHSKAFYVARPA